MMRTKRIPLGKNPRVPQIESSARPRRNVLEMRFSLAIRSKARTPKN
jgi:hypothetical protein